MRPDWDEYFLRIAEVVSQRSTCARRHVGCVLTDVENYILSTGYNGLASGLNNCIESHCPAMTEPSGARDLKCHAVHAEANALIRCRDPRSVFACYVTVAPCMKCVNMLLNTKCVWIITREVNERHRDALMLWQACGREFHLLERSKETEK